jgi:hypothetical protein
MTRVQVPQAQRHARSTPHAHDPAPAFVLLLWHCAAAGRNCLAFGPGLLPSVMSGVQMPFLIQAVDTQNERSTSGGDRFAVRVVSADGKLEGEAEVRDLQDGKYEVQYRAPLPGAYLVHVSHADLGCSEAIPVHGSPFKVEAADPWTRHRLLGSTPTHAKVQAVCRPAQVHALRAHAACVCDNAECVADVLRRARPCQRWTTTWCCWAAAAAASPCAAQALAAGDGAASHRLVLRPQTRASTRPRCWAAS